MLKEEMVLNPPEQSLRRIYCQYGGHGIMARRHSLLHPLRPLPRHPAVSNRGLPEKIRLLQKIQKPKTIQSSLLAAYHKPGDIRLLYLLRKIPGALNRLISGSGTYAQQTRCPVAINYT